MITIDRVTVTYPDGSSTVTALDHASLSVTAGELVAVVGPSGSGKSTLLSVAAGLVSPSHGDVRIGAHSLAAMSVEERTQLRRSSLGVVFQQSNLIPSLTTTEQLTVVEAMTPRRHRRPGHDVRRQAAQLLEAVGMTGHAAKRPHQLSGGQRQRVNIARALMGDPQVLLVDEPTSALDHARGTEILDLLRSLTNDHGTATLLVTHDTDHLSVADAVVTVEDGRLSARSPRAGA